MTLAKRLILVAAVVAGLALIPLYWPSVGTAQESPGAGANPPTGFPRQPNHIYSYRADWTNRQNQVHHELDNKTRTLVSQYRQTEDEKERTKLVEELSKTVADQFDNRQAAREVELKQLEEQLKKLRELHARRTKEKDQIVRDRTRQLLRDADGLGWGVDGSLSPPSADAMPLQNFPVTVTPPQM